MTNEEVVEALALLLEVWVEGGQEACEALLAAQTQEQQRETVGDTDHKTWIDHRAPFGGMPVEAKIVCCVSAILKNAKWDRLETNRREGSVRLCPVGVVWEPQQLFQT